MPIKLSHCGIKKTDCESISMKFRNEILALIDILSSRGSTTQTVLIIYGTLPQNYRKWKSEDREELLQRLMCYITLSIGNDL